MSCFSASKNWKLGWANKYDILLPQSLAMNQRLMPFLVVFLDHICTKTTSLVQVTPTRLSQLCFALHRTESEEGAENDTRYFSPSTAPQRLCEYPLSDPVVTLYQYSAIAGSQLATRLKIFHSDAQPDQTRVGARVRLDAMLDQGLHPSQARRRLEQTR